MNLLKRLRNLWRISGAIVVEKDASPNSIYISPLKTPAALSGRAQIIKRDNPTIKFLQHEK